MTMLILTDVDGVEHHVVAQDGLSVMEVLRPLALGIAGECEGSVACATCHVWVDAPWFDKLTPPSDGEADMLDCAFNLRETSRLSCQIRIDPSLEGLRLAVPHR